MRIYLDTNVFINALEGDAGTATSLLELFSVLRGRPQIAVTSEPTLAEILVKASHDKKRDYLDLLVSNNFIELWPVDRAVLYETVSYRQAFPVFPKLPDAIHAVTAIRSGCQVLLSGDRRMRLLNGDLSLLPDRKTLKSLIDQIAMI